MFAFARLAKTCAKAGRYFGLVDLFRKGSRICDTSNIALRNLLFGSFDIQIFTARSAQGGVGIYHHAVLRCDFQAIGNQLRRKRAQDVYSFCRTVLPHRHNGGPDVFFRGEKQRSQPQTHLFWVCRSKVAAQIFARFFFHAVFLQGFKFKAIARNAKLRFSRSLFL